MPSMIVLKIHFSKIKFMVEVWSQYQSKDSSFKVYEEPIRNFPTFTFCPDPDSNYLYEFDFTIYYDNTKLELGGNQIDNGDNSTETVYLEELYTYVSGTCYRILIIGEHSVPWCDR